MNKLICFSAVTAIVVQSQTTSPPWNVTTPMEEEVADMVLAEQELIEQFIENPQQFLEDLQKDTMQYNALLEMSGMKAEEFETQKNVMIQVLKTNPQVKTLIQQTLREQFIKEEETRRLSHIQEASTAVHYGPQAVMVAVCTTVTYFMF